MDEGAQEKVEVRFSSIKDKIATVNLVLTSEYTLIDYSAMVDLLESKEVKPLREIGRVQRILSGASPIDRFTVDSVEAESYFEWLKQIAIGAIHPSGIDVKEVYDQLFAFIYVLKDKIHLAKEIELFNIPRLENILVGVERRLGTLEKLLQPRDDIRNEEWGAESALDQLVNVIDELREELSEQKTNTSNLDTKIEETTDQITKVLTPIELFLTTYAPTLDRAKSEYDSLDKKVNKP